MMKVVVSSINESTKQRSSSVLNEIASFLEQTAAMCSRMLQSPQLWNSSMRICTGLGYVRAIEHAAVYDRALAEDEEMQGVPLSVDTFYADVAREAVGAGAHIINDVSGGSLDPAMHEEVKATTVIALR